MEKSKLESAFLDLINSESVTSTTPLIQPAQLLPPRPVRFQPSRIEGRADVSAVTVDETQLILHASSGDYTYRFATIGRRQESRLAALIKYCTFRRPWPPMVAERSWCVDPLRAYFVFYTNPRVTVYMPSEDVRDYTTCCFSRVRDIIHSGKFSTFDLN